jgi:hypothetical protein
VVGDTLMDFFMRVVGRSHTAFQRSDVAFLWISLFLLFLWVGLGGW